MRLVAGDEPREATPRFASADRAVELSDEASFAARRRAAMSRPLSTPIVADRRGGADSATDRSERTEVMLSVRWWLRATLPPLPVSGSTLTRSSATSGATAPLADRRKPGAMRFPNCEPANERAEASDRTDALDDLRFWPVGRGWIGDVDGEAVDGNATDDGPATGGGVCLRVTGGEGVEGCTGPIVGVSGTGLAVTTAMGESTAFDGRRAASGGGVGGLASFSASSISNSARGLPLPAVAFLLGVASGVSSSPVTASSPLTASPAPRTWPRPETTPSGGTTFGRCTVRPSPNGESVALSQSLVDAMLDGSAGALSCLRSLGGPRLRLLLLLLSLPTCSSCSWRTVAMLPLLALRASRFGLPALSPSLSSALPTTVSSSSGCLAAGRLVKPKSIAPLRAPLVEPDRRPFLAWCANWTVWCPAPPAAWSDEDDLLRFGRDEDALASDADDLLRGGAEGRVVPAVDDETAGDAIGEVCRQLRTVSSCDEASAVLRLRRAQSRGRSTRLVSSSQAQPAHEAPTHEPALDRTYAGTREHQLRPCRQSADIDWAACSPLACCPTARPPAPRSTAQRTHVELSLALGCSREEMSTVGWLLRVGDGAGGIDWARHSRDLLRGLVGSRVGESCTLSW